jgi:NAD(P)-dependent dehydrogenase (short-subunit alcohol dehydrogenase family)
MTSREKTGDKKRALVTGGGSGIGFAIARALKAAGADVAIAGRDERRLKDAGLPYFIVDVTDEGSIASAAKAAGTIDIFIANAGAAPTAATLKTSRALWDEALAVNLTSAFFCAQAFVPGMIERGWGRFIVVASTAAHRAYPYAGAYCAAKHGVLGWVKTLALEHAKSGVTFNALCPGFTDTPLIAGAVERLAAKAGGDVEAAKRRLARDNPMGRLVAPEEVAAAAVYLASEAAASVNGQSIIIDGGELVS